MNNAPTCIICMKVIVAAVFGWFCSDACAKNGGAPPAAVHATSSKVSNDESWDGGDFYDNYVDGRGF